MKKLFARKTDHQTTAMEASIEGSQKRVNSTNETPRIKLLL